MAGSTTSMERQSESSWNVRMAASILNLKVMLVLREGLAYVAQFGDQCWIVLCPETE